MIDDSNPKHFLRAVCSTTAIMNTYYIRTIEKIVSKNGDKINPKDVVKKLSKH